MKRKQKYKASKRVIKFFKFTGDIHEGDGKVIFNNYLASWPSVLTSIQVFVFHTLLHIF